jgi:chromosome segregation protein
VEREEIQRQISAEESESSAARGRLEGLLDGLEGMELRRVELEKQRPGLQKTADELRAQAQDAAQRAHGLTIQADSLRTSLVSLRRGLERQQAQREQLEKRVRELEAESESQGDQLGEFEVQRETLLEQRGEVEKRLDAARKETESVDSRIRSTEQARHAAEQAAQETRQQQEQRRLSASEARVRSQGLQDQLEELKQTIGEALEALPEDANESNWQIRLETLGQKVQRLGAINLAAIEEYSQESERKEYLETQQADLRKAVATLEAAIQKIDRETRTRFENTYNAVNAKLGQLFTRLFGGGHAFLELTADDPLEAGVAIMARPPGKRISNIHLLSGGEKALTAIALVFTLFQLNPAPFCMLDEVDAPLDEANVERYSLLVRDMSDTVQFIVITHNKGTMETLDQLVGVTMQEPGVSRLVYVDVEEAARLAAI